MWDRVQETRKGSYRPHLGTTFLFDLFAKVFDPGTRMGMSTFSSRMALHLGVEKRKCSRDPIPTVRGFWDLTPELLHRAVARAAECAGPDQVDLPPPPLANRDAVD